ncbi:hypothetical protein [Mesotoga sp.]|uniref:hypothetical protein n=1 Tax=Mesotoga sp. TaxID=2053577 RepID=UPI00345E8FCC
MLQVLFVVSVIHSKLEADPVRTCWTASLLDFDSRKIERDFYILLIVVNKGDAQIFLSSLKVADPST